MKCRHCFSDLTLPFVDLGKAPPSNAYREESDLAVDEKTYPLRVLICENCWLVQTEDFADADEFFSSEYAYFSSYSSSWLSHSERYVSKMCDALALGESSFVIEIASNDGYLLQYFENAGVPCMGVEPTRSTANAARAKGIAVIEDFFGVALAEKIAAEYGHADLLIANNVLAHVPDINDFVSGFALLLKRDGVVTFEFPHLIELVNNCQFDTVYHEHFSYLSLTAAMAVLESNGLEVFDVEQIPTHGGSLRVHAQRLDAGSRARTGFVDVLRRAEDDAGVSSRAWYGSLQQDAERIRFELTRFLEKSREEGKRVAAYGAAAKGNTLLNFAGITSDLIEYVVDLNPQKQGKYMPGSRIPICDVSAFSESPPDFTLILPWNLKDEIAAQVRRDRLNCGSLLVAVPDLSFL